MVLVSVLCQRRTRAASGRTDKNPQKTVILPLLRSPDKTLVSRGRREIDWRHEQTLIDGACTTGRHRQQSCCHFAHIFASSAKIWPLYRLRWTEIGWCDGWKCLLSCAPLLRCHATLGARGLNWPDEGPVDGAGQSWLTHTSRA